MFKARLKKYHKNHTGMNYEVKLYKEGGMNVNQICEITNVSKASLYRKLSEGKQNHSLFRLRAIIWKSQGFQIG